MVDIPLGVDAVRFSKTILVSAMKKVIASREGPIGGLTSAGLTIRENSLFVALPSTRALWRCARVKYGEKSFIVPVLDVGPWFPFAQYTDDDDYVFSTARPRADRLKGQRREHDSIDQKIDRKSTRLNSSHQLISYAVF